MIQRRHHHHGFTLREITLSLSICSTVMMLSTGMIRQAFSWSKTGLHRTHDDQTCFHLASELRTQIHLARDVTLTPGDDDSSTRLTLRLDDETKIVYDIDSDHIAMEHWRDQSVIRRNDYRWRIPRHPELTFDDATGELRLRLSTSTPFDQTAPAKAKTAKAETAPLWRTIQAVVGLRLRYQQAEVDS